MLAPWAGGVFGLSAVATPTPDPDSGGFDPHAYRKYVEKVFNGVSEDGAKKRAPTDAELLAFGGKQEYDSYRAQVASKAGASPVIQAVAPVLHDAESNIRITQQAIHNLRNSTSEIVRSARIRLDEEAAAMAFAMMMLDDD